MEEQFLSLDEIERRFFNLADDPVARTGYVTPEFFATDAEKAAAVVGLAYRRQNYGWRKGRLDDEEVGKVSLLLATPRRSNRGESSADDPDPVSVSETVKRKVAEVEVFWRPLGFYPHGKLLHIPVPPNQALPGREPRAERVVLFRNADGLHAVALDGQSDCIHEINRSAPINLAARQYTGEDYVQFFGEHVLAGWGAFTVLEDSRAPTDVSFPQFYMAAAHFAPPEEFDVGETRPELLLRTIDLAQPVTRIAAPEDHINATGLFIATVLYGQFPFRAVFSVQADGRIGMVADVPVSGVVYRRPPVAWTPEGRAEQVVFDTLDQVHAKGFVAAVKHLGRGPAKPVRVIGGVDFSGWTSDRAISFINVVFDGQADFSNASLPGLTFLGCRFFDRLDCNTANLSGGFVMTDCRFLIHPGTVFQDEKATRLSLAGARIGGNIDIGCDGAMVLNAADVTGDVTIKGLDTADCEKPHHIRAENMIVRGAIMIGSTSSQPSADPGGGKSAGRPAIETLGSVSFRGTKCTTFKLIDAKIGGHLILDQMESASVCVESIAVTQLSAVGIRCGAVLAIGGSYDPLNAQPKSIRRSAIAATLDLDGAVCGYVLICECDIDGFMLFRSARISDMLIDDSCASAIYFMGATVSNIAKLVAIRTANEISCARLTVYGQLEISGGTRCKELNFNGASIGSMLIGEPPREKGKAYGLFVEKISGVDSSFESYVRMKHILIGETKDGLIQFTNCKFRSGLTFWQPAVRIDGERIINGWTEANKIVVHGNVTFEDCEILGSCDFTRLQVIPGATSGSGAIRMDRTNVSGQLRFGSPLSQSLRTDLMADERDDAAGHVADKAFDAQAGSLSLVDCRIGNVDLTGLALKRIGDSDGSVRADRLVVRGTMALYSVTTAAGTPRFVEASIEGALRLPGAVIGELRVTATSFDGTTNVKSETDGIVLEAAQLNVLRVPRLSGSQNANSFPVPLDLSGLSVKHWFFSEDEAEDAATDAGAYLDFLDNDEHLQRDVYASVAQTLRNLGKEDAAVAVLFADQYRADFSEGVEAGWTAYRGQGRRRPIPLLRHLGPFGAFGWRTKPLQPAPRRRRFAPWQGFNRFFLNYGWNPAPLATVIIAFFLLSLMVVSTSVKNFEPTEQGFRKVGLVASSGAGEGMARLRPHGLGLGDRVWMTLRYHMPITGVEMRGELQPSDDGLQLPLGSTRILSAEDWFGIMAILNWVMWPLLLTFVVRKLLRG